MGDFTITVRTEPFTLDEVFSFIDDTNISKRVSYELKSWIADAIQGERNKAIDEFAERLKAEILPMMHTENEYNIALRCFYEIAEEMKGGGNSEDNV